MRMELYTYRGILQAILELLFTSVSKRAFGRHHTFENVFRPQAQFHANQTHFHMKGFSREAVLLKRGGR